MLRIHFTAGDLENVRICRRPDPLWEIVSSLCRLQSREGALAFGPWRQTVADRARREDGPRRTILALRSLVPRAAYFPDFLTPPGDDGPADLPTGIDRVLSTPRRRLRHELGLLAAAGGRPHAAAELARGDADALARLGGTLASYHREVIGPVWERVTQAVAADVALRSRAVVDGGVRGLFDTLRPLATWDPPVLTVDYPVDHELRLEGRGLLLVPSYFCWRRPITLADHGLRPVLVYPVDKSPLPPSPTALPRLLGPTRAALLQEAAGAEAGRTTSELAEVVGMSLPTVSQQLAVLREGGLIVSRRDGRFALHAATGLGRRLLDLG